ncbi:alpha/beta hydrolase [Actinomadura sp. CNU-125]|uniref:alpha/beta hydrolase n=1 Tax=Actinomadura sp. CNU-125 TaxID=1904961 RepID=UPI0009614C99|nr:alpha/beta hydrolase [Actinomadura sp. CNU-125]OLT25938.1 alpha/beta hydrolase [Actinomadura sp. CNU-125]
MTVAAVVEERAGCGRGARLLAALMRRFVRPFVARLPWTPLTLRFAGLIELAGALLLAPRGTRTAAVNGLGCAAEWVVGRGVAADPRRVILYFHGGGFVACGLRTHRRLIARISRAAGMPVLSVAYRMPPKVPIATSIGDCVDAYRWLLGRGVDPGNIVVAGDSAGGYLALTTVLDAVRDGLPRPAGIAALSPFIDLDLDARVAHANEPLDPFIPARRLGDLVRTVFPGVEPTDPRLSPLHADLRELPPVLIQVGGIEVLCSDAELMAERLGAADVPCTLQIWEGQLHVFQVFADLSREGLPAIDEIGRFARDVTSPAAARAA